MKLYFTDFCYFTSSCQTNYILLFLYLKYLFGITIGLLEVKDHIYCLTDFNCFIRMFREMMSCFGEDGYNKRLFFYKENFQEIKNKLFKEIIFFIVLNIRN